MTSPATFTCEREVWAALRKAMPLDALARRIEDASGNLGTWDTFVAWNGHAGWIELKHAGPKAKLDLRPGQLAFGRDLFDHAVPGAYLAGARDGSFRMIGRLTDGDDWARHMIGRWTRIDPETVAEALKKAGF